MLITLDDMLMLTIWLPRESAGWKRVPTVQGNSIVISRDICSLFYWLELSLIKKDRLQRLPSPGFCVKTDQKNENLYTILAEKWYRIGRLDTHQHTENTVCQCSEVLVIRGVEYQLAIGLCMWDSMRTGRRESIEFSGRCRSVDVKLRKIILPSALYYIWFLAKCLW